MMTLLPKELFLRVEEWKSSMVCCRDASSSGRWCVVVPKPLRQELLEEAHSTVYAGHFSNGKYMIACVGRTGGLE